MASYRGHLMLAAPLGAVYGALPMVCAEPDWGLPLLGAGFCTVGGLLPDLDSASGVPVRELFGLVSAIVPAFLYQPLSERGLPLEHLLVVLACVYLFLRYAVADSFRRFTVHRGMFHSIPAMLIAGLLVYLGYPSPDVGVRLYLSGGVMLGFLSHLILDEIYSVDFNGVRLRFNKFAGTAVKFTSPSWTATLTCYALLLALGYAAWQGGIPDLQSWPGGLARPSWLPTVRGAP